MGPRIGTFPIYLGGLGLGAGKSIGHRKALEHRLDHRADGRKRRSRIHGKRGD